MKQLILSLFLLLPASAFADSWTSINSLTNPGFETGDFSGWTVTAGSSSYGVADDGAPIPGVGTELGPAWARSHSGSFTTFAVVARTLGLNLVLTQSIFLPDFATAEVGFFLVNGGAAHFGADSALSSEPASNRIVVNGQVLVGLFPAPQSGWVLMEPGQFVPLSTQANLQAGWNTISFEISGSGTYLAGECADDFFVHVPEASSMALLPIGLLGVWFCRKSVLT